MNGSSHSKDSHLWLASLRDVILYVVRCCEAGAVNQLPGAANLLNLAASSGQGPAKRLRTWRPGILDQPWLGEKAAGCGVLGKRGPYARQWWQLAPSLVLTGEQATGTRMALPRASCMTVDLDLPLQVSLCGKWRSYGHSYSSRDRPTERSFKIGIYLRQGSF